MKETIGIIGANGFVGRHLIEDVRNNYPQYDIVAFVHNIEAGGSGFLGQVKSIREIDVLNKESLVKKLQDIDILVYSVKGDNKTIVEGLENTLEIVEKLRIKKIIYLSSIVVFGNSPEKEINEDSPLLMEQDDLYNMAKVQAEIIVDRYRKNGILNIITIRPGYIYGEGGLDHTIYFLDQIKSDFKNFYLPIKGRGIFNGVYVKNLVRMIMLVIQSQVENKNFNGLDGFLKTWYDLFRAYAGILGKDIDKLLIKDDSSIIVVSKNIFSRITAKIKKAFSPNKILISEENYETYSCQRYYGVGKAKEILNYFPPFSFQAAIENIKKWAINNYVK